MATNDTKKKRPTKLYELLAVEQQLKGQAKTTRTGLQDTFTKRGHLFEEVRSTYQPIAAGEEATVDVKKTIQTTVREELAWIAGILSKAMDTSLQVAHGDTVAMADVVLDDGTVLLTGVPATALLELDKRVAEVAELLKTVPTLDPAKGFVQDAAKGEDVFRAREIRRPKTQKRFQPLVLAPATDKHPAQVKEHWVDDLVGHTIDQEWSSLITPATKADMLARAEELRRSVVKALQRANDVEVDREQACGAAIFGYVFGIDAAETRVVTEQRTAKDGDANVK